MQTSIVGNLHLLKSNWAILIGAASGAYIGLFKPEWIGYVSPFGKFYLDMLSMCVLPILLTAIALSLGRLLKQTNSKGLFMQMLKVFLGGLVLASSIGLLAGLLFSPGSNLGGDSMEAIGNIIQDLSAPDLQVNLFEPFQKPSDRSWLDSLFHALVPANIFSALNTGETIKVLFFSILLGIAVGSLKKEVSDHICVSFEAIYSAFSKLVMWLMYIFPFGLCGLLATTLSKVGVDALIAMVKFVPVALFTFILWFLLMSIIIWWRTGSFWASMKALKDPITISLGTASAMACLPSTLKVMNKEFGFEKQNVDLLIPLTFNLCRIGPTLYFALATVFIAQIYNVEIGMTEIFIIIFGSIVAGMATAGASGVAMLTKLSLVSVPLGLPLDAVLVLFIVIDPLIGPFRVLTIVHTSCAILTLVMPKQALEVDPIPAPANSV